MIIVLLRREWEAGLQFGRILLRICRVETLAVMTREYLQKKQKKEVSVLIVSPIEVGEKIEENPYGIYMGGRTAVERSRQFPKYYKEIAEKHGFGFMIGSEYAEPCDADSIHMDAGNHKKLAEAVKAKWLKCLSEMT